MAMRGWWLLVFTAGLSLPAAQTPSAPAVLVEKHVEARMRDGTVLRADVYRPDGPGRFPALLQRTPYSKNARGSADAFRRLSASGYVVIVQDTRGRYMSDGIARPHDEADDGYDTVEWAARLPYVDGRVGMFGGSYLATTQLAAASRAPAPLVALFPSSSYASRYDMVFQGGAFYLSDGLGWNLGQAADVRRRILTPDVTRDGPIGLDDQQQSMLREQWLWHVPLKSLDVLDLRRYAPGYFEMLAHPSYDEYWKTFDIASRHGQFQTPALHLTGWYDTLLTGTLRNFSGLRAHARTDRARNGQRLVVGPWTHARPTLQTTRIGGVDYGPDAGLDSQQLMERWFEHWLKQKDEARAITTPVLNSPVRIFVMGENRWRDEAEWPLARARSTAYYLHSAGSANARQGNGTLSTALPSGEPTDRFVYNPTNPVPTGAMSGYSRAPADVRQVEDRSDVLVYTSEPLPAPVEATGPVALTLWIASSAPDTDFTGRLVDVLPDGTARALTDGILRARYRRSSSKPELLTPGRPTELTIDLGATSNVFGAGHRIRVEISSSNFPRFDRNPNTGGEFGASGELRRAEQTVFHDRQRPSRLILPIVPR
jgi:putative CocE/NonD family hydrolase